MNFWNSESHESSLSNGRVVTKVNVVKNEKHGNIYNTTIHKEGTCPDVLPRQQPTRCGEALDGLDSPLHTA